MKRIWAGNLAILALALSSCTGTTGPAGESKVTTGAQPQSRPEGDLLREERREELIPGDPIGTFPQSSGVVNGQFRYSIPIVVPPGRAGMEPRLSLQYSSDRRQDMLGWVGWSIGGLSQITRCESVSIRDGHVDGVNYDDATDNFCLDGVKLIRIEDREWERLPNDLKKPSGLALYGAYALENSSANIRVLAFSQPVDAVVRTWVALHPNKLYRWYGETENSRLHAIRKSTGHMEVTLGWLLSGEVDNDNRIDYSYMEDFTNCQLTAPENCNPNTSLGRYQAGRYIDTVTYTRWTGPDPGQYGSTANLRKVKFNWDTTPESNYRDAWINGVRLFYTAELLSIDVFGPYDQKVRTYQFNGPFSYGLSLRSYRNLLHSVTVCDPTVPLPQMSSDPDAVCQPPTVFTYSTTDPENTNKDVVKFTKAYDFPRSTEASQNLQPSLSAWINAADLTHDGYDDIFFGAFSPAGMMPSSGVLNESTYSAVEPFGFDFAIHCHLHGYKLLDLDLDRRNEIIFTCLDEEYVPAYETPLSVTYVFTYRYDPEAESPHFKPVTGYLKFQTSPDYNPSYENGVTAITVHADFDGDQKQELILFKKPDQNLDYYTINIYTLTPSTSGDYQWKEGFNGWQPWNPNVTLRYAGGFVHDMNGDGRVDFVFYDHASGLGSYLYVDDMGEFQTHSLGFDLNGVYFVDVNGDHLPDAVKLLYDEATGATTHTIRLNTGDDFTDEYPGEPGLQLAPLWDLRVADFNEDGRDDMLLLKPTTPPAGDISIISINPELWLSNGTTFTLENSSAWDMDYLTYGKEEELGMTTYTAVPQWQGKSWSGGVQILDANNDGLVEIAVLYFAPDTAFEDIFTGDVVRLMTQEQSEEGVFGDILVGVENGLGNVQEIDYANLAEIDEPCDNTAEGALDIPLRRCVRRGVVVKEHRREQPDHEPRVTQYSYHGARIDMHGRGFIGFERIVEWDPTTRVRISLEYDLNPYDLWGILFSVPDEPIDPFDDPDGSLVGTGKIEFKFIYGEIPDELKDAFSSNGFPLSAKASVRRVKDKEWRITDAGWIFMIRKKVQQYHPPELIVEFDRFAYPLAGAPSKTEMVMESAEGQPLYSQIEEQVRTVHSAGDGRYRVWLDKELRTDVMNKHGDETRSVSIEYVSHDEYGYPERMTTLNAGGSTLVRELTYKHNEGQSLLGLIERETLKFSKPDRPNIVRTFSYSYSPQGELTERIIEPESADSDIYQRTIFTYWPGGLLQRAEQQNQTASLQRGVDYQWTTDGGFISRAINDLGEQTTFGHSSLFGALTWIIDPNGHPSIFQYDTFGRLRQETAPDGSFTEHSYYKHSPPYPFVREQKHSGGAWWAVFYDELLRPRIQTWPTFDGSVVQTNNVFDQFGRIARESTPHPQGTMSPGFTDYSYDDIGVLTSIQHPDGNIAKLDYYGLSSVTVTDEVGRSTRLIQDADGRISKIDWLEVTDPMTACSNPWCIIRSEQMQYDAAGQLRQHGELGAPTSLDGAAPPGLGMVSYDYDIRGRLISFNEPNTGVYTLKWNALNDLQEQRQQGAGAPSQLKTACSYDATGRLVDLLFSDGVSVQSADHYTYGTVPGQIGLLASARRDNDGDGTFDAEDLYDYDNFGRLKKHDRVVGGESFSIQLKYDGHGRVGTVEYPAVGGQVKKVKYQYNPYGYLWRLVHEGTILWELLEADVEHMKVRKGATIVTERKFSPLTGLLDKKKSTVGTQEISNHSYDYYADGRLKTAYDWVKYRTEKFSYDDLGRLTSWTRSPLFNAGINPGRKYIYDKVRSGVLKEVQYLDASQNISKKVIYGFDADAPVHAVKTKTEQQLSPSASSSVSSYFYDPFGRELGETKEGSEVRSVSRFNRFNLSDEMDAAGQIVRFLYNTAGERVSKENQKTQENMIYHSGFYERRTDGQEEKHFLNLFAAEGSIGRLVYDPAQSDYEVQFLETDHRGSTELVLDENGMELARHFYSPFGIPLAHTYADELGDPADQTLRFAGHDFEADIGLYNMQARLFDPSRRRFTGADPIFDTFDVFAYVGNDPMNRVDPDGRQCDELSWGSGCGSYTVGETGSGYGGGGSGGIIGDIGASIGEGLSDIFGGIFGGSSSGYSPPEPKAPALGPGQTSNLGDRGSAPEITSDEISGDDEFSRDAFGVYATFDPIGMAAESVIDVFSPRPVGQALDRAQTRLDVLGLVPGPGELADAANALISAGRGVAEDDPEQLTNAGFSAAAAVPFLGWTATAAKWGGRAKLHHIATWYRRTAKGSWWNAAPSGWGPAFKELFESANLSLRRAKENLLPVPGHKGPHPDLYHFIVHHRLVQAVSGLQPHTAAFRKAFTAELDEIAQEIKTPGSFLNRILTKGDLGPTSWTRSLLE